MDSKTDSTLSTTTVDDIAIEKREVFTSKWLTLNQIDCTVNGKEIIKDYEMVQNTKRIGKTNGADAVGVIYYKSSSNKKNHFNC